MALMLIFLEVAPFCKDLVCHFLIFQFKTNSGGNSPVADLSKFSYTPGKQAVYDTAYEDNSDWQLELDTDQADDMEFETEQEAEIQSRRVSDWMELEMFQKHREQCCTGLLLPSFILCRICLIS